MILFLDVISSIPEFSVIDDNKIVFSCNIVQSHEEKLSDNIFSSYIKINKSLDLEKRLKSVIITTGPGSYTSLRVGAAFLTGLQYSKDLNIIGISSETILNLISNQNNESGADRHPVKINKKRNGLNLIPELIQLGSTLFSHQ